MTLIVITPPEILPEEVKMWEALFLAGLQLLHVRKPNATILQLKDMLNSLPDEYHSRVILHQHHKLCEDFKLGGIHFKGDSQADENQSENKSLSRSKSCHTPLEVLNNYGTHDYVFLSPIFNSISKKGYPSAFYPNEIRSFFQENPQIKNCIALGGIDNNNIQNCMDYGFAGCALLGAIWEVEEIEPSIISERYRKIQSTYNPTLHMNKHSNISSFQFISNDFSPIEELEQIQQVCKAGAQWVQLRLKNRSEQDILELGKQAAEICQHYQAKLIINDHVHLAKAIGAHGVHLGKADMSPTEARKLLGSDMIIGGTANNINDIRKLHKAGVDYIGLGPYRFTQTKKNLAPVLGLQGYTEIIKKCRLENIQLPIVAIGGIELVDIPSIMACGLHGIALSSSITSSKNIIETTQDYLKQITPPLCKN